MGFSQNMSMPALFLGHGSPMNAIEENIFVEGFRAVAKILPTPKFILVVSAHWETRGTMLTSMEAPRTIHDFGDFPESLFKVEYPAPGSPSFAKSIIDMVKSVDIKADYNWGLDHGTWSVVRHLFPKADIPIVQLSLDYLQTPEFHYFLGRELSVLRDKGVLIIGSGNMVHNLRMLKWDSIDSIFGYDWALEASEKMKNFIINNDYKRLINYRCHGKAFELAVPTPEHYLPLLYVMGVRREKDSISFFNDKPVAGSIMMTSLLLA